LTHIERGSSIVDAVDTALGLLDGMSQMIVGTEFNSLILRGALTTSPPIFEKIDDGKGRPPVRCFREAVVMGGLGRCLE
jgi:hypothetical protein